MVDTNLSTKVELFFACSALQDLDVFSKSDPVVVVYSKARDLSLREIGRTETIKDNLNPKFKKSVIVDYFFEEVQNLLFQVFDVDGRTNDVRNYDFLGEKQMTLASLVAAPTGSTTAPLLDKSGKPLRSRLTVTAREVSQNTEKAMFTAHGIKLDKKDLFGKSDPYLKFFCHMGDGIQDPEAAWRQVHETEIVKNNLNPVWRPFTLSVQKLCNGNYEAPILCRCYDWDRASSHDLIGEFSFTLRQVTSQPQTSFVLIHPRKQKDKGAKYKGSGEIVFSVTLSKEPSFLEFLAGGGMQLRLTCAIDFTASNGHPADPGSLHYIRNADGENDYLRALRAVGEIIIPYDTDQKIPVYGFGGKIDGTVSHCFPLTFSNDAEVEGLEGIIDAYRRSFQRVVLSGPTLFEEIIRTTTAAAYEPYTATFQHYNVLLILTDGVINDMPKTIEAIIDASSTPMSIIIVGVGEADFSQMNFLDSDDQVLALGKKKGCGGYLHDQRDIVQFVPFRDFKGRHYSELAKHTLAELPKQVLGFAKMYNIKPLPPRLQHQQTFQDDVKYASNNVNQFNPQDNKNYQQRPVSNAMNAPPAADAYTNPLPPPSYSNNAPPPYVPPPSGPYSGNPYSNR